MTDGNVLVVEGYGTKSSVEVKCLSEEAVKKLIGGSIPSPPDGGAPSCYQVVVVSSDSSQISKAIASFANADDEFGTEVKKLAGVKPSPKPGMPAGPIGVDAQRRLGVQQSIAATILADAISGVPVPEIAKRVRSNRLMMSAGEANGVRKILESADPTKLNGSQRDGLAAAVDALK